MKDVRINVRFRDDEGNIFRMSEPIPPAEAIAGGAIAATAVIALIIYAALILI